MSNDHPLAHFPITIDPAVYDEIADACGEDFARSYLTGAVLRDGKLLPRTQTGWEKMKAREDFVAVMAALKITLLKPPLFVPDRADEIADRRRRLQYSPRQPA